MLFRSDRKSTRLNSSHTIISYAVFCLKKKKKNEDITEQNGKKTNKRPERHTLAQTHASLVDAALVATPLALVLFLFFVFFFLKVGAPRDFHLFPHRRLFRH